VNSSKLVADGDHACLPDLTLVRLSPHRLRRPTSTFNEPTRRLSVTVTARSSNAGGPGEVWGDRYDSC